MDWKMTTVKKELKRRPMKSKEFKGREGRMVIGVDDAGFFPFSP
jgi:hypothetical protein